MPATLTTHAIDRSTYAVDIRFADEAGAAVVPSSATWTLSLPTGAIVNGRSAVAIAPLAARVTIVLAGADLAYADGARRYLTVEAVYTSSLGSDLPLKDQAVIIVDDLVVVT